LLTRFSSGIECWRDDLPSRQLRANRSLPHTAAINWTGASLSGLYSQASRTQSSRNS